MRNADRALLTFLTKHGRIEPWMQSSVEELMEQRKVSAAEALCDGGFLEEATIVETFEAALRLRRVDLDQIPPNLPKPLDQDTLKVHLAVPAQIVDGRLILAMVNPLDDEAIRKVRFASGLRVIPAVAPLSAIRATLDRPEELREPEPAPETKPGAKEVGAANPEPLPPVPDLSSSNPIIKMAALIVEQAIASRASDIHLEPNPEGLIVRYRIDGILEEATRLSPAVRGPLTARFKVMARLDIAERRVPQDGRISVVSCNRTIDGRVSTLPTQYGEKVVIRLLDPKSSLVDLDRLGFEPWELQHVQECLQQSEGIILTTGPTGSGKSTTLYSMLRAIQSPEVNIITVENPIEYRLAGITQTEVNERQGLTFAGVLRSILRQDPDVILVGEIRDQETAEIALQAAQTGHLVLSTLHTNDAVGVVTRLVNLGMERELIASSLLLVIAQRLVRSICPNCREPAPAEAWRDLPLRALLGDTPLVRGVGCSNCRKTGYRGRLGIYEVFRNTVEAKRLIKNGSSEVEIRDLMRQQGGRALMQVALAKVRAGQTTLDEVAAAIKAEEGITSCPGCRRQVEQQFRTCPFCGTTLRKECAACHAMIQEGWERCPQCGTLVTTDEPGCAPREQLGTHSITLSAARDLAAPSLLGAGLRAMCVAGGLDDAAAGELETAVVETCNLAINGSADGAGAEIKVEIELSAEGCSVCVSGDGPPWPWPRPSARLPDLDAFAAGDSPEVRAFLIRGSADEVTYERIDQTNRLWLSKRSTVTETAGSGDANGRMHA